MVDYSLGELDLDMVAFECDPLSAVPISRALDTQGFDMRGGERGWSGWTDSGATTTAAATPATGGSTVAATATPIATSTAISAETTSTTIATTTTAATAATTTTTIWSDSGRHWRDC